MGVVDFPRDAQGRIIVDPSAPAQAVDTPATPAPRPIRALDPRDHASPTLPGAQARATDSLASLSRVRLVLIVSGGLLIAALLIVAINRAAAERPPLPVAVSTPAPAVVPTAAPTATPPAGTPISAALVAWFDYKQPETATALEPGTYIDPVARIGHAWVLVELAGGGQVWVRWGDLPNSPALDELPDEAPTVPTSAPPATSAPAAAPTAPAACNPTTAPFRVPQRVPPYGSVEGVSCVSLDEAAARAEQLAAELRATAEARP